MEEQMLGHEVKPQHSPSSQREKCALVATVLESLPWMTLPSAGQCSCGPNCLILSATLSWSLALRDHNLVLSWTPRRSAERLSLSLTKSRLVGSRTERFRNRKSPNTETASGGSSRAPPRLSAGKW